MVAAMAILAAPGSVLTIALGLRGFWAVTLAPALSISIVAVSAIVGPLLGLRWSWMTVALGTLVISGTVMLVRRRFPGLSPGLHHGGDRRATIFGLAGVFIGLAITLTAVVGASSTPEGITQGYDTVFHLNAVQNVLDTGNASSFAISSFMLPAGKSVFYPAAWHALVSLLVQLTGISIPAATNIMWLLVGGIVWPLSCVFFVRVLAGSKPAVLLAAGALAAAFPAFPYLLLYYGTTYPNALADAIVPQGLGLCLIVARGHKQAYLPRSVAIVLLVLFLPGAFLAQPNSIFAMALILTPLLAAILVAWLSRAFSASLSRGFSRLGQLAGLGGTFGVVLFVTPQFRSLFNYTSPKSMSFLHAIWRSFTSAPEPTRSPAIALTALVILGLLVAVARHRLWWMIGSLALTVLVYALAVGSNGRLAEQVLAPWWDNPERVAALLPMVGVPLAAIGLGWLCGHIAGYARRVRLPASWRHAQLPASWRTIGFGGSGAPLLAGAAAVALTVFNPTMTQMDAALGRAYHVPASPQAQAQLDTDELALIGKLDSLTTPNDVIANNPYNGSGLAMALAHRKLLFPYSSMTPDDGDLQLVSKWLNTVGTDPAVCAAAHRKGMTYLLDFGTDFIAAAANAKASYPGIDLASGSGAFSLVAQVGHAKLYKLQACAGTSVEPGTGVTDSHQQTHKQPRIVS
jgi:hypothetical protein